MTMYSATLSEKASTLSIFDQDLAPKGLKVTYTSSAMGPAYTTERLFALNRFNFDNAHETLIPQAVAYSAGLINHFFRGQMEITAPDEGVYGIVDHSTGVGFTTIKLKLRNTAPDNEAMSGGTLVAVAKFHRNGCYQPDLSEEFTQDAAGTLITPCDDYRTEIEEISASNEVNAAPASLPLSWGAGAECPAAGPGDRPCEPADRQPSPSTGGKTRRGAAALPFRLSMGDDAGTDL